MQLITAATVLPGPAGERIPDGAVLVDGTTVHAVGPRAEVAPLAEDAQHAQKIQRADFPEHTVLPGLLNAHVHLAFDTTADWYANLRDSEDPDLLLGMAGRAQRALAGGVTILRDLGDRNHLAVRLRDAIDAGDLAGPRVLSAGSPITVPDGHCWFLGGEAADERAIRARVAEHAEAGADLVKVMASGGSVTPNSPPMWQSQFGLAELRVLVARLARRDFPSRRTRTALSPSWTRLPRGWTPSRTRPGSATEAPAATCGRTPLAPSPTRASPSAPAGPPTGAASPSGSVPNGPGRPSTGCGGWPNGA